MSEREIDESGRNPTQQRMDEEGVEDVPVAPDPDEPASSQEREIDEDY